MIKTVENSPESLVETWREQHFSLLKSYAEGSEFIDYLLPEIAVQLNIYQVLDTLKTKLGNELFYKCIDPGSSTPSPKCNETSGEWLKSTNIVGVNVRTVHNFFNVVKYCLTLPASQDCIHLLPIWEPGVVNSLYGKVSWNINPEFYSSELATAFPHLNTIEKQLKVTTNFIHALGKTVGMDVIPHCDRFAEMVFSYPQLFEWVQQEKGKILQHSGNLHSTVQDLIWDYLKEKGSANVKHYDISKVEFFDLENSKLDSETRNEILFGYKSAHFGRQSRRIELMQMLLKAGFETLPMTMAPPYRGLTINAENFETDGFGNKWYNYEFINPEGMSRVFGPLTRYKFHEVKLNSWELEFEKPIKSAWEYLAKNYWACQQEYNFDFMRGDMAHVQARPKGVPEDVEEYYDPLRFIKEFICNNGSRHFAFYAETFLAPDNVMSYGNEAAHLDAIKAEATLGDLQSTALGTNEFRSKLEFYFELEKSHSFKPSFTILTSDKDDPRFDKFFHAGNIARYFIGTFLGSFPSYMSLGFETRERNIDRAENNMYSKLFVFTITDKKEIDKYTTGPYQWNQNHSRFKELLRIRRIQDDILAKIDLKSSDQIHSNILKDPSLQWSRGNFYFTAALSKGFKINLKKIASNIKKKNLKEVYRYEGEYSCYIHQIED